jgi:hypothetical protein
MNILRVYKKLDGMQNKLRKNLSSKFSYKMQTKYDINAQDFIIREHTICVSSTRFLGLKS